MQIPKTTETFGSSCMLVLEACWQSGDAGASKPKAKKVPRSISYLRTSFYCYVMLYIIMF
jgi:hypothetical protein